MGKINGRFYNFLVCFTAGVLIGALVGTIGLMVLVSHRIDEHHKIILSLENIIEEKDAKLEKLEDQQREPYLVLQEIEVELSFSEEVDEMDEIVIEKAIKEKYTSLFGKEIKTMDPEILMEVVDNRILKVEDMEYKVYIDKLILTETLKLFVKIEIN